MVRTRLRRNSRSRSQESLVRDGSPDSMSGARISGSGSAASLFGNGAANGATSGAESRANRRSRDSSSRGATSPAVSSGDDEGAPLVPARQSRVPERRARRSPVARAGRSGGGGKAAAPPGDAGSFAHVKPRGGKHDDDEAGGSEYSPPISTTPARACAVAVVLVTIVALADLNSGAAGGTTPWQQRRRVLWCGWITAVSTGLGVLPFFFLGSLHSWWMGLCNALAAGMMISASLGLLWEGGTMDQDTHAWFPVWARALAGTVGGGLFIIVTQRLLAQYEDLKFSGFSGASAKKMLIIMAVMTLHSFTEGVGIGVSFAGESGSHFGMFISTTLAIHNVPEGLAICLVLIPRGVSLLVAGLWAVVSSLPQPLMAVPAYMFVQEFLPLLPAGLGFAAGAMLWVAIFELLAEALDEVGKGVAFGTCVVAATCMGVAQHMLR